MKWGGRVGSEGKGGGSVGNYSCNGESDIIGKRLLLSTVVLIKHRKDRKQDERACYSFAPCPLVVHSMSTHRK